MGIRKKSIRMVFKHFGYYPAALLAKVTQSVWHPEVTGNFDSLEFRSAVSNFERLSMDGTDLCLIMKAQGSDKGRAQHNYSAFYSTLFDSKRMTAHAVFEMGIGTNNEKLVSSMGINGVPGASLRGWRTFFDVAHIFAGDIDRNILFSESRIKCFYCDQLDSAEIGRMWSNTELSSTKFDVMIDDGLHTFDGGRILLENSFNRVALDGYYIIEDILANEVALWKEYLPKFASQANAKWAIVKLPHPVASDNTLIVLQPSRAA